MRVLITLSILLLSLTASSAQEDARSYFNRGKAAFALGKYEDAAELYEKAFGLHDDPALLYNAAQAHRLGGNKKRALMLYENYVKLYGAKGSVRAEIDRHIAGLKAAIEADARVAAQLPQTPAAVTEPPGTTRPTPLTVEPKPTPAAVVVVTPPPPRDTRPVWKKGWFWGAVGGGAAVVILGVGLGVGLGVKTDPNPSLGTISVSLTVR